MVLKDYKRGRCAVEIPQQWFSTDDVKNNRKRNIETIDVDCSEGCFTGVCLRVLNVILIALYFAVMSASGHFLNLALLRHPKLLEDFPQMMSALDAGEFVNIHAIRDESLRNALVQVFQRLPVEMEPGRGFYKSKAVKSIGGFLLMDLLDQKVIKQPTKLSTAQMSNGPVLMLSLLSEFPDQKREIVDVMRRLVKKKRLDYPEEFGGKNNNKNLQEQLCRVFIAFGARKEEEEDYDDGGVICFPSTKKSDKVRAAFKEALKHLDQALGLGGDKEKEKNGKGGSSGKHAVQESRSGSAGDASSDDSSDDSSEDGDGEEEEEGKDSRGDSVGIAIGPAAAAAAAAANDDDDAMGSSGDGSDDEYGPLPAAAAAAKRQRSSHNNDKASTDDATASGSDPDMKRRKLGAALPPPAAAHGDGNREEWMLTPGSNSKGIAAAMNDIFDADGVVQLNKSGKFLTGKAATMAAKGLQAQKLAGAAAGGGPANPADVAAQAMLAEYDQLRGPSLMEQHLADADAKKAAKRAQQGGKRSGFDYERDVANSRVGTNTKARDDLVNEAKTLSSRFDKAVQR
jgi:hypothetical protein